MSLLDYVRKMRIKYQLIIHWSETDRAFLLSWIKGGSGVNQANLVLFDHNAGDR
jgi:hypothetical protein